MLSHYGSVEAEAGHDGRDFAAVGDDARNPVMNHLVRDHHLASSHLYAKELPAHELTYQPLGRPGEVVYPLVPGLRGEGDICVLCELFSVGNGG